MILLLAILVVTFVVAIRRPDDAPLPQRPVVLLVACAVVALGYLGQRVI